LKTLVKSVLSDLAKVVIDYPKDKKADTGGFIIAHKAKHEVSRPQRNIMCDLEIRGNRILNPMEKIINDMKD